jgi:LonC protease-like protein
MVKEPVGSPQSLDPSVLRRETDPATLGFATTAEISDIAGLIGQDRAVDAIRLAASIPHRDFNLFVLGPVGTGRHRAVDALLKTEAAKCPVPSDWAYVNNFDAPHCPSSYKMEHQSGLSIGGSGSFV